MKRPALIQLATVFLFAASAYGQSQPYYQSNFPPEEFRARWEKVLTLIGPESIAVLQGAPQVSGFIMPRQDNNFYYLSGIETPHSYILLDGRSRKVTFYLPPRNPRLESAEGRVLSGEDAALVRQLTGADSVKSTDEMRGDWLSSLEGGATKSVYTPFSPAEHNAESRHEIVSANAGIAFDFWDGRLPREAQFVSLLRTRYPRIEVKDLTPVFDEMRGIKSPREIALIRRASQLAGLGMMEAMRSTRAGLYEYHLDAAARYVFLVNGARLDAYRSITAAGTENIGNMHYYRNLAELKDGDLILMDYAPDYYYYVSDIGRMWPVNGKYSAVQRELVGFVLEYHRAVMSRVRPGVTADQIMEEARKAMEAVFARWKFSKPIYEEAARRLVETGGGVFSHTVGMAVHDVGSYRNGPLQPGQVFSIDPQMRVPEENLYLRYEDTIVVTENGYENFTAFLPSELDEIERLMKEEGVVQKSPLSPAAAR